MRIFLHPFSTLIVGWLVMRACDGAVPANDECENAIDLTAGANDVIFEGSTLEATVDGLNLCGDNIVASPGVWYLYQATSEEIGDASTIVVQVSTCTDQTDFDTALTVYSGFCSGLQCVGGKDDDLECGTGVDVHSTISWHAEANTRYYILVHGSEANHTGNFGLTTSTVAPAPTNEGNTSPAVTAFPSLFSLFSVFVFGSSMLWE